MCFGVLGGSVGEVAAFGSGQDLRVLGSRPTWGSLLSGKPASPSLFPSPYASACHSPSLCSLSNNFFFKEV